MTYAQGGTIEAADFNTFVSTGSPNLNSFWSIGSSSEGYGQTAISTVSVGSLVEAESWANLINSIASAASHQGTSITSISVPTAASEITYESALSTNLSTVYSNILNATAVATDITSTGTRTADWGTNAGLGEISSTVTVTFPSANQARYFFNAGGSILISCSRTGGDGSAADLSWTTLCDDVATLGLPASSISQTLASASYTGLTKFGGTGTPDIYVRQGFYNLTSTPFTLFRQFSSSGVYTSDYVYVTYSFSGAVLTITVNFVDSVTATVNITGNLSVTAVARPPSDTYITNTWGTAVVSVTAPA